MPKRVIHLGPKLSFEAHDFLESKLAILGKSGRGKSGGVRVILEQLCEAKLPFVAVDMVGLYWGLRSSFDGKQASGYQVLVIGGEHGDLPFQRNAGAEVAQAIVDQNISAVIDMKGQTRNAQREFVRDFAHELYRINRGSRLFVLEEASKFAPQHPVGPDMNATLEAVETLVSVGRNQGIGTILVNQRPATLNKDLLSQVDTLVVFGAISPHDKKALRAWVEDNAEPSLLEDFDKGLATLQRQEAWVWSPQAFGGDIFEKVRFQDFHTMHPDRTHLRRMGFEKVRPVTTDVSGVVSSLGEKFKQLAQEKVDLKEIPRLRKELEATKTALVQAQTKLQETKEAPPKADPKEVTKLKEQISSLEDNLDAVYAAFRVEKEIGDKIGKQLGPIRDKMILFGRQLTVEVRALEKRILQDLQPVGSGLDEIATTLKSMPPLPKREQRRVLASLTSGVREKASVQLVLPIKPSVSLENTKRTTVLLPVPQETVRPEGTTQERDPKGAEKKMLLVLAPYGSQGLSRQKLGVLAGLNATSGYFINSLSFLRSSGLIVDANRKVVITQKGLPYAGGATHKSHEEIIDLWFSQKLAGAEKKMLKALDEAHPQAISREDLGARIGIVPGSGYFINSLSALRSNGLIEDIEREDGQGKLVKLAEDTFPQ